MRKLTGHRRDVRAVAFTPDGRVVSGGGDGTVRVWDAATGGGVTTFKAPNVVYAVAAAPDGKTVASAGRYTDPAAGRNSIHFWDLATGRAVGEHVWWTGPEFGRGMVSDSIWSLAYSADGGYLAAACRRIGGGNIPDGGGGCCIDARGRVERSMLPGDDVYAVAFAPTGGRLALTRGRAAHFLPYPLATEGVVYPFAGAWAPAVAFVPRAELAAVGSNSFLYFVNPVRTEKATVVKTGVRTVAAVAASPDGRTLLVGGRPGAVEVYDVATRARTTSYDFGIGGLHALAYAPDGLTFAAAGDAGLVVCDAPG